MTAYSYRFFAAAVTVLSLAAISYSAVYWGDSDKPESFKLVGIFPSEPRTAVAFDERILASPLLDMSQGRPLLIVAASNGIVAVQDADTGALAWQIAVPVPDGQQVEIASTPALIGDKLVVLYQCLEQGRRTSHRIAVIDLSRRQVHKNFPVLTLSAELPTADGAASVKFNPPTAYSHAAVKHAVKPGADLGFVYASFGNAGDAQPFHGWIFEIDMDAWQQQGVKPAVSSVLVTTPEAGCPVTTVYGGTTEMICGGGIWTPAGPQIYQTGDGFELLAPTGNGQVDLARRDYANAVMRLKPGLQFDPGCDTRLCANFNPGNPSADCIASCKNLFIPRLPDHSAPLRPHGGECDDKTFWECLARMDYDLGSSAPIKAELQNGASVLVQPAKDGGVYLIDADHLGMQYDRLQIVDLCGTLDDGCTAPWRGMIVTQPVMAYIDRAPVVVIATFVSDKTHPAGLVALKIVLENGRPQFRRLWQFPDPKMPEAVQAFRSHPSLPAIASSGKKGEPYVWVVDIERHGVIYGVRLKDGALAAKGIMQGTGRPLSMPIIHDNKLYIASDEPGTNKFMMEAYRIEPAE
ncbi:hypothetical protein [Methylobacter sp. BlB1]|uniref:hypothetical protein n=1 Tax=Methylobacter sp. BlB1 TaxID=2785914 RepID=UPI001895AEC1|nr:hypothetical protein [Methylobacter sp. BlB1]MBF6650959.1 hypothetical protein [Methylobacter sp. BlB1]